MSHFYSEVTSSRSTATKCGSKQGLSAHLRGWNIGVKIYLKHDETTGKDKIEVYQTGGSNKASKDKLLIEIKEA